MADPVRPERDLQTSVSDGFSLVAVGDCLCTRPLTPLLERDPAFSAVSDLLHGATLAFGNMETSILDIRAFSGSLRTVDDWGMLATPDVADDLRSLGFRLMSRANNHAMDWGDEGLRETGRLADAAGIVHAGTGERLANARAPRYVDTSRGRVGLVSFASMPRWDQDAALDPFGEVPGRPGVNPLRLRRIVSLPPAALESMIDLGRTIEPWATSDHGPQGLTVLDTSFEPGDAVAVRYEPDAEDLDAILRAIRLGKQHADALVVSAHIHEEGPDERTPPGYLTELARRTIDAGADVFAGHGVHRLWPVEIHSGRPILYGLGNFVWSDIAEAVHGELWRNARAVNASLGAGATDADVNATLNGEFLDERYFRSVIAKVTFDAGNVELRLHPIDLGGGRRLTERGIPRVATLEVGEEILKELQAASEPFGTSISVADGLGLVRSRA
jgi:poly-gamma-glutamate capsule biosynthesis protein CapA/YwtB (metallophosphatase superfamily)